ncbi:DUF2076 domain-containing protein [Methylocystis heyeri]|uniref:DUF2076 family protein n=1 Tax=Methylocystis heyeri TaxID=391905 RepID=A0A6B8KAM1_9HYPH|nr:DUF2076 domain-containing protein [Methylocystis heyeri]QGM44889.1 DUF2076 family protein [Methylocystis heyeri]
MSPEERQLLAGLFERIKNAASSPRDQEAESFINEQVKAQPSAPYLLAQTVIVQDFALQSANQKLQQLEARLRELESAPKPSTSFLGGLLGGGAQPSAPPPRPSAPPPPYPQSGPWGSTGAPQQPGPGYAPQQSGFGPSGYAPAQPGFAPPGAGGFLKGALGAAAGVAGGVLLADSIRGLFHGGGAGSGLGIDPGFQRSAFGPGEETTIVNNYYGDPSGGPSQDAGYDQSYGDSNDTQDADYEPDDGYDDGGGDGGFDV